MSTASAFSILSVPTGPVGAVAVAPNDPKVVYLGGAGGLFRSTDGGETWTLLSRDLRYPHVLLVDPFDGRRLYAARRDLASFLPLPCVFRSSDGGAAWENLTAGLGDERIFALALDPLQRGVLYAGSWAGRVYRSLDGGDTWAPVTSGPVREAPGDQAGTVRQIAVSPVDGAVYAVQSYAGAFRSDDGGASWKRISTEGGWLAVDPQHGSLYLAGRRVLCSESRGERWIDISGNLACDPQIRVYGVQWIGVNPEPLVLYTRCHCSTDGGLSWERLDAPASFMPRLLVPGNTPVIYGSVGLRPSLAASTPTSQISFCLLFGCIYLYKEP